MRIFRCAGKKITKINPEMYYVSTVCMFCFSQKYILIILGYSLHPRPPALKKTKQSKKKPSIFGAILTLSSRWRHSTEMGDRCQKPTCSSHPHVLEVSAGVGALPPVQTCLNITSVSSQRKGKKQQHAVGVKVKRSF